MSSCEFLEAYVERERGLVEQFEAEQRGILQQLFEQGATPSSARDPAQEAPVVLHPSPPTKPRKTSPFQSGSPFVVRHVSHELSPVILGFLKEEEAVALSNTMSPPSCDKPATTTKPLLPSLRSSGTNSHSPQAAQPPQPAPPLEERLASTPEHHKLTREEKSKRRAYLLERFRMTRLLADLAAVDAQFSVKPDPLEVRAAAGGVYRTRPPRYLKERWLEVAESLKRRDHTRKAKRQCEATTEA